LSGFRPLLQDGNLEVRRTAAFCLANALGTNADVGVFPVAIELLRSSDDNDLQLDGLTLSGQAAEGRSPFGPIRVASGGDPIKPSVDLTRLGDAANEIADALTEVASKTQRDDFRTGAWRLLDDLNPDFRSDNPQIADTMEQKAQMAAFEAKVQSGQVAMPEMLEGLKQFPKAAPIIAEALVHQGADACEAVPALGEALSLLAPPPEASAADRVAANGARERLANAMQKIAPDLPKPLFTMEEIESIMRPMLDPAVRADVNRRSRISAARKAAAWPGVRPFDVSPEQMRRLLAALKEADAAVYDAVTARVKELDPLFR
jgi:hypothetical protein